MVAMQARVTTSHLLGMGAYSPIYLVENTSTVHRSIFEPGRGDGGTVVAIPESHVTPSIYFVMEKGGQQLRCKTKSQTHRNLVSPTNTLVIIIYAK